MEPSLVDNASFSTLISSNEFLYSVLSIGIITFIFFAWLSTRVSSEFRVVPVQIVELSDNPANTDAQAQSSNPNNASFVDTEPTSEQSTYPHFTDSETSDFSDNESLLNQAPSNRTKIPVRQLSLKNQLFHARKFKDVGHLVFKIQFLDENSYYVHADPQMLVWHFKIKYFRKEILQDNKKVRLIHQGHELLDRKASEPGAILKMTKLSDYTLTDDSILHCLVTKNLDSRNEREFASSPDQSNSGPQRSINQDPIHFHDAIMGDFDFGTRLLMPIFCLLLSSSWLLRIAYRQYFSVLSTMALIGLTLIFAVFTFAMGLLRYQSNEAAVVITNQSENTSGSHTYQAEPYGDEGTYSTNPED